jgi:hypothetical protein
MLLMKPFSKVSEPNPTVGGRRSTLTDMSPLTFLSERDFGRRLAAAMLCLVGGLHFPFSNQDGLAAGRAAARAILANRLLLRVCADG